MAKAKSVEEIVQIQLGAQALQIARLLAENEQLREQLNVQSQGNTPEPSDPA